MSDIRRKMHYALDQAFIIVRSVDKHKNFTVLTFLSILFALDNVHI